MPADAVWDVYIADDGYLWVATEGGLVRFDGIEFTVFKCKRHDAFTVDDVRRIAAARDGNLWLATYGGASYTSTAIHSAATATAKAAITRARSAVK